MDRAFADLALLEHGGELVVRSRAADIQDALPDGVRRRGRRRGYGLRRGRQSVGRQPDRIPRDRSQLVQGFGWPRTADFVPQRQRRLFGNAQRDALLDFGRVPARGLRRAHRRKRKQPLHALRGCGRSARLRRRGDGGGEQASSHHARVRRHPHDGLRHLSAPGVHEASGEARHVASVRRGRARDDHEPDRRVRREERGIPRRVGRDADVPRPEQRGRHVLPMDGGTAEDRRRRHDAHRVAASRRRLPAVRRGRHAVHHQDDVSRDGSVCAGVRGHALGQPAGRVADGLDKLLARRREHAAHARRAERTPGAVRAGRLDVRTGGEHHDDHHAGRPRGIRARGRDARDRRDRRHRDVRGSCGRSRHAGDCRRRTCGAGRHFA